MTSKMTDYKDSPYESDEKHVIGHSFELEETLRSLKEEIRCFKVHNDMIIHAQEKQAKVDAVILHRLSEL